MQAIITKYLGPTNYRGARVKATAGGGISRTINWDHETDVEANHRRAARSLIAKLGWANHGGLDGYKLVSGGLKEGFAFVLVPADGGAK